MTVIGGSWGDSGLKHSLALASKKTFLKARHKAYGMFIGTDGYSGLESCRSVNDGN